jgi:glycosyltransferase involved in cell wall biosynthesis
MPKGYPLISVVLATYNGSQFVSEQLDSIFSQTYPNIEVVVVDDCSTDDTRKVLEEYSSRHSNMRLFINDVNIGFIKNFEKGMLLASGDFIAPSDQDDIWLPQKLTRLMDARGNAPIVYCNSELIDENGKSLNKKMSDFKRLVTFDTCLNYVIGGSASGHALLIERKIIHQAVPLTEIVTHDYWIGFVGLLNGPLKYLDECLVLYRQHNTNVLGLVKAGERKVQPANIGPVRNQRKRVRIELLYRKCPDNLKEKAILSEFMKSYENFRPINNFKRMILFFRYNNELLAFKNRSQLRRWMFCLKMFVKLA